jgi:MarR family transcriptional regulator, transcriptional regulator for hemolysin
LESKRPVKFSKARPEESLGYMFYQTSNLWQRRMVKALKPTGLTLVQLVLLAGVAWLEREDEPITQARLARQAKTDVMMTSQVLKKLESRGLVSKRPSESDTSANVILLTGKGAETVAKALRIAESVDSDFFRSLEGDYGEFLKELGALTKANGAEEVK